MPGYIRSNNDEVSQRRPVLGFTVRTGGQPFFEVAVASDPELFRPEAKARRTASNFWSSRAGGALAAERGEAVYMLPHDALARFAGNPRLFYAVATFADATRATADARIPDAAVAPYVRISPDFAARPALSLAGAGGAGRWSGNGYGAASAGASLEWAGDAARPGVQAVSAPAPAVAGNGSGYTNGNGNGHANGNGNGNGHANGNGNGAAPSAAAGLAYDDGFDPQLWSRPLEDEAAEELDGGGIEGPIPDEEALTIEQQGWAGAMTAPAPEYPHATRFVAAHSGNFRQRSGTRTVRRIVIHITDGNRSIAGPISWFQNPRARVSAHYIVGQDGEVVQMVRNNDVAWHANGANGDSIGIEHVASRRRDILPTVAEYCASARLVRWLCQQYGLPLDRQHIVGHREADTRTDHRSCPDSAWDWDYYMGLVLSDDPEACRPPATQQSYGASRVPVQRIARPPAAAMEVGPVYQPNNTAESLRYQADFQRRLQQWRVGVGDTSFFPHAAICHFEVTKPSGEFWGTGFYIGNDMILTCAHNVVDRDAGGNMVQANSITVYPGRNGQGSSVVAPFTVNRGAWEWFTGYGGTGDFDRDMALIRVPTPPRNGEYFRHLQSFDFTPSTPVIVCGYSAQSVDPYRQHMDGDTVRALETPETVQFNLQAEPGASGSPVYYVYGYEDEARGMSVQEIAVTGVFVAVPAPGSGRVNVHGCRLTPAKLAWIDAAAQRLRGTATSHGLQYRAPARQLSRSVDFNWDGVPLMGQPNGMACWATSGAMLQNWRYPEAPLNPQQMADRAGLRAEFDNLAGLYPDQMRAFATASGLVPEEPQSYSIDRFVELLETKGPLWVSARTPGFHVIVVTGVQSDGAADGSDTVVRIHDPWDRAPGAPGAPGAYRPAQGGGSRYLLRWADFLQMYESRATTNGAGEVNVQIVHAGGTGGRTPNYSPAPGAYSFALGGSGRTSRALSIQNFSGEQMEIVRNEFVNNAASAQRQNCITIVNSAMRSLYGGRITGRLGSTIHDTMGALQNYGLAGTAEVFEFLDASGRLTRGVVRPDHLQRSVEDWIMAQADANQMSAHYLFGLSVMDGYHSVILGLDFSGPGDPGTRLYWADQVHGGWDPIVGRLDQRITSKTQGWWDPLPADRKARTRVTLWPLIP